MANNPFDPPIVQVKKTLDRGGFSTVNRGFGSIATPRISPRAPEGGDEDWPEFLSELGDVDTVTNPPTNGQTLVWDGSMWVPGSGGGGGGGGVLLLESGASVPGGTPLNTIIYEKAPSPTQWDFKGLSSLPVGWSRRGVASETFAADGMSATYAAGQGHQVAVPGGSATVGTLEVKLVSGPTSGAMIGPILKQTGGIGACTAWYSAPSGALNLGVNSSYQYDSTFTNGGGAPSYPVWFRIRLSAGSTYSSYSLDGTSWSSEVALAKSFVIEELSIGSIFGSAAMKIDYAEWIPDTSTSGLRGWWDGAQIVPF